MTALPCHFQSGFLVYPHMARARDTDSREKGHTYMCANRKATSEVAEPQPGGTMTTIPIPHCAARTAFELAHMTGRPVTTPDAAAKATA